MSDTVILGGKENYISKKGNMDFSPEQKQPSLNYLQNQLDEASVLVDDIILKKYLHNMNQLDIVPLDESLKQISDIRLFKITEMVYQKKEYSTYKFASVFNAVQNLNCGIFIVADSDGEKTDFYMGVRSLDGKRTTKSLKDTLKNALCGQFPGVKTQDLLDPETEEILSDFETKNIVSVSCVAENKDNEFKDNERFIQGLEKLAVAMHGQKYTIVVLAKSTPATQLDQIRKSYETIYTQLSPYANMQMSYGTNMAISISDALSHGIATGKTYSKNISEQKSKSHQESMSESHTVTKPDTFATIAKAVGTAALGVASLATAPLTGGASIAAAAAISVGHVGINTIAPKQYSDSMGMSKSNTTSLSQTTGETYGENSSVSDNNTHSEGTTSGKSNIMQLTMQNKGLLDILKKIDLHLKRIDECESIGMWECAAYVLSDTQETAEMAAGTYKALMKGEQSGIEVSAINFWGRREAAKLPLLREYITNFIHPIFEYQSAKSVIPITAASLVSSNELAIQMGLPRKSVCGFPVIEHAEFGKEVVKYDLMKQKKGITIGQVFSMGNTLGTKVDLDCDSLTMHTFVTGSTGSGKSNTVYEILNQLRELYGIPFLVIEPAKGEYKNIFGQFHDVTVYGTNPKINNLLKINPFRFPSGVHILEHLDRLVEIFNVCWPMYAAMPAILKEAMEKAYVAAGWNLNTSENNKGERYPNFAELLEQIECVIRDSEYSVDSKGDYSGALVTRLKSLTNGLNGQIFCSEDLKDEELFDKNVIVDLSRVGSIETKSLIMGLLIMRLNEYRMDKGGINSPLMHITVLEEAHNLLKRTSTQQSSESSNLLGKSVELLSNSIAEMRTYGEGFVIADQAPGLLDMSVIRNTNTKIILRLPEKSDRELVGYAAGLKEDQVEEIAKLRKGIAVVYQNDWVESVLVKINKCSISEKIYSYDTAIQMKDLDWCREQLIKFMIHGRLDVKSKIDIDEIKSNLEYLGLSLRNIEFVEDLIAEYECFGTLEIWKDENFRKLSIRVTDILECRKKVEYCVLNAHDNDELTDMLREVAIQAMPSADGEILLTLSQCFMKDMSIQQDENELRKKIYWNWIDSVKERGMVL